MAKRIRAILVDIDDTLLPTNGDISNMFHTALTEITELIIRAKTGKFPPIGWCSGRDRNYVEAVSFFLGLPDSWSIIESGIALFNPTTKAMIINDVLTEAAKSAFETIRCERLPRILSQFPYLFEYPGNMVNIALERKGKADTSIEECYEAIKRELSDLEAQELINIHHSRIAIDISPRGIDKASGVRFFAQHSGINVCNMLGIGDSRGDFPMLDLVGVVGCPDNATEECKKLVRSKIGYVSPLKHAEGVIDIINHLTKG